MSSSPKFQPGQHAFLRTSTSPDSPRHEDVVIVTTPDRIDPRYGIRWLGSNFVEMVAEADLDDPAAVIKNTFVGPCLDWAPGLGLQGHVAVALEDGTVVPAFVEVFPPDLPSYVRGEGETVAQAERACWEKLAELRAQQ